MEMDYGDADNAEPTASRISSNAEVASQSSTSDTTKPWTNVRFPGKRGQGLITAQLLKLSSWNDRSSKRNGILWNAASLVQSSLRNRYSLREQEQFQKGKEHFQKRTTAFEKN